MDIIRYKEILTSHILHIKMINRLVKNIVELDDETMNFLNGPRGMKAADNVKNHSIGMLEGIAMTMSNQLVAIEHTIGKYPSTEPITKRMIQACREVPTIVNDIGVPYELQEEKDRVEQSHADSEARFLSIIEELEEFINKEEAVYESEEKLIDKEDYNTSLKNYRTQYLLVDDLLGQLESLTELAIGQEGGLTYKSKSSEIVSYLCGLIEGIVNVSGVQLSVPVGIPEEYTEIHSKLISLSKTYKKESRLIIGLIMRRENSEVDIKRFQEELDLNKQNKRIAVTELNTVIDKME